MYLSIVGASYIGNIAVVLLFHYNQLLSLTEKSLFRICVINVT